MRFEQRLRRAYLAADPRALAVGRIVLAVVLLIDLGNRLSVLRDLYTNAGLLPNHTLLWRLQDRGAFSLFFTASTSFEAAVGFVVCGAAYLFLLIGFRTRLAQVASLLCVVSLHARTFQNGGDLVLGQLALWTAFLPTGRRYSVDSLLARLRARPERSLDELADRQAFEADRRPVQSLAVGAVLFQLAFIYALNALQKDGPTWRAGTAVHYVLHQDTVVTSLGLWVRGWLSPRESWALSRLALGTEAVLPVLLLSPFAVRTTRHLAVALAAGLHIGFALLLHLEIFTPAMLAFLPNLLPGEDFDALERRWRRLRRPRTVLLDETHPFLLGLGRVLARLDPGARLTFQAAPASGAAPLNLAHGLAVLDPERDQRWTGVAALAELARSLPSTRAFAWVLGLPGVRSLLGTVCNAALRQSGGISSPALGRPAPERVWRAGLRELGLAFLIAITLSEIAVDNRVLASRINLERPAWIEQTVAYLQLLQPWYMFAPDVPVTDRNLSIDAVTSEGRHVDPFNEVANPGHPFPGLTIPGALHQNSFLIDYAIQLMATPELQQAFHEWVLRYPERTGRPQDKIVSYKAYVVEDDSPPPGERQPRNARATVFYEFGK